MDKKIFFLGKKNLFSRYFVIDLMIGGDLATRIQNSVFDEHQAKVSVRQILEGVAFIHRNDIVHRGWSTKNIRKKICISV